MADLLEYWESIRDPLGPAKMVLLHDAAAELKGFVVIDNVAAGPTIGGVRMATDVSVAEVFRLARAMTLKNAAAGLAHGGGKAGIVADPRMGPADKERVVRAFARAIADLTDYIPGPDMGTNERSMAFVHDEIGRCVGLPRVLGGIPLDEIGATGFGVAVAAEAVRDATDFELAGARVVIQGFGAVGRHAARYLLQRGAIIVGASDSRGATVHPDGLDLDALSIHKASGESVSSFPGGNSAGPGSLIGLDCDVWVPAARPDVFDANNAGEVKAKVILQGANIPATPQAERIFHERGILCVPDFIANAGGVICAAVEYHGGSQPQALAAIDEKIRANTTEVIERARSSRSTPRHAARSMAQARVEEAVSYRRRF